MFRPNLQNEDHRRAWALLQAVPEGQKSAFLVKAILDSARQDALESTLRRVLREELQAVPSQPVQQSEEAIPPEMLGFLNNKLIEELRFELRQLQEPDRVSETIDQTNLLLDLLDDAQPMLEFEPSIFKSMIKEITVYPEKFSFVLSNGLVLCEMRR